MGNANLHKQGPQTHSVTIAIVELPQIVQSSFSVHFLLACIFFFMQSTFTDTFLPFENRLKLVRFFGKSGGWYLPPRLALSFRVTGNLDDPIFMYKVGPNRDKTTETNGCSTAKGFDPTNGGNNRQRIEPLSLEHHFFLDGSSMHMSDHAEVGVFRDEKYILESEQQSKESSRIHKWFFFRGNR